MMMRAEQTQADPQPGTAPSHGSHLRDGRPVGVHDVGGRPAPRVEKDEHPHALWEYRVDAMMMLLSARGLLTTDELRRHIEGLGAGAYDSMDYYERWCAALAAAMIERGVVTADELGRRMAEVAARQP